MKKSIRVRLFIGICSLVFFFVFLSWLLNTQYLEKYYLSQKRDMLKASAQRIDEIYTGDPEEIAVELERLENTMGGSIIIFALEKEKDKEKEKKKDKEEKEKKKDKEEKEKDKENEVKYSSLTRTLNHKPFKRRADVMPDMRIKLPPLGEKPNKEKTYRKLIEDFQGKYAFQMLKDPELKIDFLTLTLRLKNGELLFLRVPVVAISESVEIANDFMMCIGIIIIVLGTIWAYIFSNRFTKPILQLNRVAQSMANLDFTQKCVIEKEDEIGELGKSINYLSNQLDSAITELHEKNQKLTKEIERERQIDEMRKQFISNVSHELKTPISLIQGYAEGLKINVVEDEENKQYYCDVIIDESDKMDKLVKELLNLSQLESGVFQLERSDFDITHMIQQILYKYKGVFEEKNIQLEVDKMQPTLVNADPVRIEQVISNYLNNALNHVDQQKQIRISIMEDKDKVRVSVFNSGKKIPEEALDKLWISFYKVDKARTREYGGYGLGLSIVRAIQEQHHNGFGVSNVNKGVVFWFELDKSGI